MAALPPLRSRPTWRGLALLWGSSRLAVVGRLAVHVVTGVLPAVTVAASATLIDRAPGASASASARGATIMALVVLGAALVLGRVAQSFDSFLHYLVAYRFGAAVDRLRLEAVGGLPGLAHFDSARLADQVQAGQWASQAASLLSYAGTIAHWSATVVASGVVVARLGWWAPALVAATAVPGTILNWHHAGARKDIRLRFGPARRQAAYHAELALGLRAGHEVRLFGLGDWLVARQGERWAEAFTPLFADMRAQLLRNLAISAAKVAVLALPFAVAFGRLEDGTLSAGSFSAVVIALGMMVAPLRWLEDFPADLRRSAQFLPELFALVDLPSSDPRLVVTGRRAPPAAPAGGLRFEDVRFTYPGGGGPVLDGLDLEVPAGASLALVGENGAGKSTVVKLLCRFYDPDEGRITLDGVDLREFDLAELRRRMAVVFQDFTRLPMSAADNVSVGCVERTGDGDLLAEAAAQSGAAAVVDSLADGWDTVLDRRFGGVDLSGGEWQRVALARAMATRLGRRASILVLDEPTAALDVRLEHDLYERFALLTAGCTTVLVSHRFSTVRMADRIAVMERGRVVELGAHADLVAAAGRYAELYELQARRFRESGMVG